MRFSIWKSKDGQYYFLGKGNNGETMITSETYTRKASAQHAINVIKEEARSANVLDMTDE
jgi:uncharacterized protein YegP (UPF0339 family)